MKGKIHYLQLLFVMLLFVVSACGGNEDDITPPEPETPAITVPDSENLRPVLNQEGGSKYFIYYYCRLDCISS